jgi:hypothetical protein
MSDKDLIVDRLVNEAGLREFKERHFPSKKGEVAPVRKGPVSTRRQWFDSFFLEMDSLKSGTFSIKVSAYNDKTGGLQPLLKSTGLSRFEADQMYGKAKNILIGK